jgi:hypothetical protein
MFGFLLLSLVLPLIFKTFKFLYIIDENFFVSVMSLINS